ncbi:yjeF C-terminal region, hydroxyethylthiazole kinase-related [Granulicatella balaenopterae]|uniref:ADP-dependent (S)-NAD(P)H-hydrate dehydratase n=1 Tax=Granulicatella balaenopterae TaxID=137733 RepID=A0A1H9MEF9_9LACT|nr:NAD(P)H-hydrate dehydratase [Granulicatella balaenopterae]SER22024.1 yjeF C-terminal region, hydroxyethylthiazole kinase-related [Granulicatella balaenopterae]
MYDLMFDAVQGLLPTREVQSFKGTYGRIAIIAGNEEMGGAGILASSSALYSGAGLVTTYTAPCNHAALHARLPEAMVKDWQLLIQHADTLANYNVILIGPGLGINEFSTLLVSQVIQEATPEQVLIMDASAIRIWAELDFPTINSQVVFTPHLGEFSAISSIEIEQITLENSRLFLEEKAPHGILVLKSHETKIVTSVDCWRNTLGNPGMAIGGTGDVLAGMIAGFTPQTNSLLDAVKSAVYTHSYIGDLIACKEHIVLPSRLIEKIPETMYTLFH